MDDLRLGHEAEPRDAAVATADNHLDFDAVESMERERGEEFIQLFNEIDYFIKRLTNSSGGEGFYRRLQWAVRDQPALKRYVDDLLEYSELRNALVHDRQYPNKVIAVPTNDTLVRFRRLVERVTKPRHVIPVFACELRVFHPDEPLSLALQYMHERGFTQIVARQRGELQLATASGITRWLAAHLEAPPLTDGSGTPTPAASRIDLTGATIADVLELEKPDALGLLPAAATLEEAVDTFQHALASRRGRLFALLITEHGRPNEPPLGIITPADLLDEE